MHRITAFAQRYPWVVDILLVLSAAAIAGPAPNALRRSGVEWLAFAAIFVPLLWRRRAPTLTFWAVFSLFLAADIPFDNLDSTFVALLVAVYALARYRPRRPLWPAVAALVLVIAVNATFEDERLAALITPSVMLAGAILLGVYRQTRRAYLDSLIERAERLERERDQQARLAVAAERSRIAREMHDIVAHNLAVMVALAEGASYSAGRAPEQAATAMAKVSETGRLALTEMRRLVGVLRDAGTTDSDTVEPSIAPTPQPVIDDIPELVDQVRAAGQRVMLRVSGDPVPLSPGCGLAAYRIVQEALTNALKHAGGAATVDLRLAYSPGELDIEVVDDGAGQVRAALPSRTAGQGIPGMIERATSCDGVVVAGPRPDHGWRVHAQLPVRAGIG